MTEFPQMGVPFFGGNCIFSLSIWITAFFNLYYGCWTTSGAQAKEFLLPSWLENGKKMSGSEINIWLICIFILLSSFVSRLRDYTQISHV
jgi:hypothetical protein